MAILKNQEVYFAKLNPARPDRNKMDPTKPNWNLQCRTLSKEQRKEWIDMGLKPRVVRENKEDDESKVLYYSVNFRKNVNTVRNGQPTKAEPPSVVNGHNEDIDGGSIGNGSICNLRLFRRDYEVGGVKKVGYTLMAVQVIKHIVYVGTPMEDFDECETEVMLPTTSPEVDEGDVY
jgi:hypothetical protein